jgi:hypothetical protein
MRDMILVSEIQNREELTEMKSIVEVFVVNHRIRELAKFA